MKKVITICFMFFIMIALGSCSKDNKIKVTISAAASLQNSLTEIEKVYEKENPNIDLIINYASSGTLEQQIEEHAPVDLFISAGQSQMDRLEQKNLIDKDTRINLLKNDLVLISNKSITTVHSVQDILNSNISKVGIGTPETVPAGKYAKESLISLNLWDSIQSKLVPTKDVTQVLSYVILGDVEVGFVYRSDAVSSKQVNIVATLPESSHDPILYPASILSTSENKNDAKDFLNYLQEDEAKQVFEKYGFTTIN